MYITKKLSVALVACLFSIGTMAASSKVVVVNMQAAILQADVAKKQLMALEANADFAAMKAKYDSLRADLGNMEKDAQTNGMTWTDEQKMDYRKKAEYKNADLKLAVEKLKAEQNAVMKRIMQEQAGKAKEALNEVVVADGIGLVLDAGSALFATPDYDITAKITEKLNKK